MADIITQIGLIASEIWHFIDDKGGESKLSEILNSLNHPQEFILFSLGWLVREGQAFLGELGEDFKVTIKKREEEERKKIMREQLKINS